MKEEQMELPLQPHPTAEFGLSLYPELLKNEHNVVFSPESIRTALALAASGARGKTAEQMSRVLHLDNKPDELIAAGDTNTDVEQAGFVLHPANALWIAGDCTVRSSFLGIARRDFGAEPYRIDFFSDPDRARILINTWVNIQTGGKIPVLLPLKSVSGDTRIMIVNALYFLARWATPFPADGTNPEPFHVAGAESVVVPMMHLTSAFGYTEGPGVQILELPYRGAKWSMLIILPEKTADFSGFETSLTPDLLGNWLATLERKEIVVSLPRFTVRMNTSLSRPLIQLGMSIPFNDLADFSGISEKEPLRISEVIHAAFVDVNELGTEAAAATAVELICGCSMAKRIVFHADHPFLFLIRDRNTGAILFMGRVLRP